jgi:hypothetical protein
VAKLVPVNIALAVIHFSDAPHVHEIIVPYGADKSGGTLFLLPGKPANHDAVCYRADYLFISVDKF